LVNFKEDGEWSTQDVEGDVREVVGYFKMERFLYIRTLLHWKNEVRIRCEGFEVGDFIGEKVAWYGNILFKRQPLEYWTWSHPTPMVAPSPSKEAQYTKLEKGEIEG